jgi:chromosome partitioning protein
MRHYLALYPPSQAQQARKKEYVIMGRIVAVTNLKGGIGKTTTVVNVGAGLALSGARVLLVDVDAQGNLAIALGMQPRRTIYEVLIDHARVTDCIVSARPNLDLIAADDSLLSAQTIIAQRPDWSRVLHQALQPIRSEYDVILIDVPGSLTVLSANALAASHDLLVPTTVDSLSMKGLTLLFKQVSRLKNTTGSIRMIVPTMFDSRLKQSGTLLEELQRTYGTLVTPPIRVNVRLSEATAAGRTIYEYDPRSRGALDYAHLVDRLRELWKFPATPRQAAPAEQPAPAPAPPAPANGTHAPAVDSVAAPETLPPLPNERPMVTGRARQPQTTCPHCGRELRHATVAGYRVAFCDHCKYKRQELVNSR